jgi:hypothetical protein
MTVFALALLGALATQSEAGFWDYRPVSESTQALTVRYGEWLVPIRDLDNDGFGDLAASSRAPGGPGVWLLSGRTGAVLGTVPTALIPSSSVHPRPLDTLDDVDADGKVELLMIDSQRQAVVISTASGAVLRVLASSAFSVCSVTDMDQDGCRDAIVISSSSNRAYSGRTGVLIRTFGAPFDAGVDFGEYLDDAGDANGDGTGDFVIGARRLGRPVLYNGRTGAILARLPREEAAVAGVGDWDGDGRDDVACGGGMVEVYSSAGGALLYQNSLDSDRLTGLRDADGDGAEELFCGDSIAAVVVGSKARRLMHQRHGEAFEYLGASGCFVDDRNGDNHPEFAVGAGLAQGKVVFHLSLWQPILTVSRGSVSAAAGEPFTLTMKFPPDGANFRYRILVSTNPGFTGHQGAMIPLQYGPMLRSCLRNHFPPMFYRPDGVLDWDGNSTCDVIPLPGELAHLAGRTLWFAAANYRWSYWTGLEEVREVSSAIPVRVLP